MFDEGGGFSVLGHHYRRVTDLDERICAGDIIRFCPPLDRDAEWYMFEFRASYDAMVLVNWLGYKAGLENVLALVRKDDVEGNIRMIPLRWFKDNWRSRFIGESSFENAQFFKYARKVGT
ncbi:hypothetical protein [Leisingera sp. ANG-DT]|uniref:hypothetical protein n=1 Tax=Leisingera sp. ANG-DT TaxID=1577897 RepID=UPI00057D3353|nr:hypothetical protein [Leisingera sp. ANG-DT]KIC16775.1 hypothetical protein RA21_11250 [Leisingera sp. ANG-DT]